MIGRSILRGLVSGFAGLSLLVATSFGSLVSSSTPARADGDVAACLKVMSGYDYDKLLVDATDPKALECLSQAAGGDVVMIAVIAAMTILMATGAYDSYDSCEKVVDSVIAGIIIDVFKELEQAIDLSGLLGATFVNSLNTEAAGAGVDALRSALAPIFAYIDCGCAVSGTAATVAADIVDAAKDCASCAKFVLAAAKEAVKAVGEVAEGIASFFATAGEGLACIGTFGLWCPGSGNDREPAQDLNCSDVYNNYEGDTHGGRIWCGPGAQCATTYSQNGDSWNGCADCQGLPFSKASAYEGCGCQAHFTLHGNDHGGLGSCSCEAPFDLASIGGRVQCACPLGSVLNGGACSSCGGGHVPDSTRTQCISCGATQHVSDDGLTCEQCPAGQGFVYASGGGSAGQCQDLSCPAGQHRDLGNSGEAFQAAYSDCRCDAGSVLFNGSCAKTAQCSSGQYLDSATNSCVFECPTGGIYHAGTHSDLHPDTPPSCEPCAGSNMVAINNQCSQCESYERAGPNNTCNAICTPGLIYTPKGTSPAMFEGQAGAPSGLAASPMRAEGSGGLGGITMGGSGLAMTERGGAIEAVNSSCQACPSGSVAFDNTCHACSPGTKLDSGGTCASVCGEDQAYDPDTKSCTFCQPGQQVTTISTVEVNPRGQSFTSNFQICARDPNGPPTCGANEMIVNDFCEFCPAGQTGDPATNTCVPACGAGQVFVEVSVPAGAGGYHPTASNPGGKSPPKDFNTCISCAASETVVGNACVTAGGKTSRPKIQRAGNLGLSRAEIATAVVTLVGTRLGGPPYGSATEGARPGSNRRPASRRPSYFPFGTEVASYTQEGARQPTTTTDDPGSRQGPGTRPPRGTSGRQSSTDPGGRGSTVGAEPPPTTTGPSRRGDGPGGYGTGRPLGAAPGGGGTGVTVGAEPPAPPTSTGPSRRGEGPGRYETGRQLGAPQGAVATGVTLGVEPPAGPTTTGPARRGGGPGGYGTGQRLGAPQEGVATGVTLGVEPPRATMAPSRRGVAAGSSIGTSQPTRGAGNTAGPAAGAPPKMPSPTPPPGNGPRQGAGPTVGTRGGGGASSATLPGRGSTQTGRGQAVAPRGVAPSARPSNPPASAAAPAPPGRTRPSLQSTEPLQGGFGGRPGGPGGGFASPFPSSR